MIYPTQMEVNGRLYNIDTSYKTALACFKAINDKSIKDIERSLAVITLLLGPDVPIEDTEEALKKCGIYLRCGREANQDPEELDMDYFQDERAIRTSIRQCYHENVNEKDYHWWEYNELIEGLTEETLLSKIREIRSFDLSKEKDPKQREKIRKAKEQVALKNTIKDRELTDQEQQNVDEFMKKLEEV